MGVYGFIFSPEICFAFVYIFLIGLFLLAVAAFLSQKNRILLIAAPVLQTTVKSLTRPVIHHPGFKGGKNYAYYFVSFVFPDKSTKIFVVNKKQGESINEVFENAKGKLTYKEKGKCRLFIGFESDV